ncbi:hypothetical protein J5J86_17285 [Aquabacter sp. L1I39]|uniref:hypothetical protein n=1 Tax=Aquabacter sp. L1I39 TaxID=2820278 RepID=UPI001ADBE39D|nr:hypothetical protein [Aquabacter sp. L1I39]QTL02532.1 hypothetical protein J5J86_17285 [Aquabacter sp. L1I39]
MRAEARSALADLAVTFVSGTAAGVLFAAGVEGLGLTGAMALVDIRGDGMDLRDVAALAWIFGQMAVLCRFVLPVMIRA